MTSPKQDERPKTLIEYMGFKDPDLQDYSHDEWCLKLLNEKLLIKVLKEKILNKEYKKGRKLVWLKKLQDKKIEICFEKPETKYCEIEDLVLEYDNEFFIDEHQEKKIALEYVITKYGNNGFSQRLGFIDVFFKIGITHRRFIIYNNEKIYLPIEYHDNHKYILFFEVKTSKTTIGAIAREIEYYRSVLWETEGRPYNLIPFLISKEKLPITQFETITFDEILQLEKEIV